MTDRTTDRWRWEAAVPLVCVAFLVPWVYVASMKVAELNIRPEWLVVMGGVLGVGIGCGLIGIRRGRAASRAVAGVGLTLLVALAGAFVAVLRIDPRIYP